MRDELIGKEEKKIGWMIDEIEIGIKKEVRSEEKEEKENKEIEVDEILKKIGVREKNEIEI